MRAVGELACGPLWDPVPQTGAHIRSLVNPERGKAAIFNALAGLAIVLLARVIAGMVQSSLGSGGGA